MGLRRLLAMVVTLGFGSILVLLATKHPSNDRTWAADHARLPHPTIEPDSTVRIDGVRDFRWTDETHFTAAYATRRYDPRRIASVWLVLAPFSTAWRGPAHTFVSFGFDDSTFVAISIEARREAGEEYGLLKGLGRNYELIYVIGDERDLIGKRMRAASDVYLYPIRAPREKIQAMFLSMIRRAGDLEGQPEFYNTASNNCTSNLVRHVNQVTPGRIPTGLKLLVPGYADDVAAGLGLVAPGESVDALRRRYRIGDAARREGWGDDFSSRIRSGSERGNP